MVERDAVDLLEGAYAIETPDDNIAYYRDFSSIYDADFAARLGYIFPKFLADSYRAQGDERDVPVADIGCGTGLVAEQLALPKADIEGFDISSDMLAVARGKDIYNALHRADLTRALEMTPGHFGAVLSAGTFTHGHLGPEPLVNLLPIARAGALFCIGVNENHFATQNFTATLQAMENREQITRPVIQAVDVYAGKDHTHADDQALILIYRKR